MYVTIFRNRKRADLDGVAYSAAATRMEDRARAQPGFISFKSFAADDGEVVAISEWESEAAARAWGWDEEHAMIQGRGRSEWYAEYTLLAGSPDRVHHFP